MYLNQVMEVSLVRDKLNTLRRPSKMFNKLKAALTGGMTPTEAAQAEVMISVIQRLNIALRRSGIKHIVYIKANRHIVYEEDLEKVQSMDKAFTDLCDKFDKGEFKRLDKLEILADHIDNGICYILNIDVVRKPRDKCSPVSIRVLGVLDELRKIEGEEDKAFTERVEKFVRQQFESEEKLKQSVRKYECQFKEKMEQLKYKINDLFPAGCETNTLSTKLYSDEKINASSKSITRFNNYLAYIPIYTDYTRATSKYTKHKALFDQYAWTETTLDLTELIWEFNAIYEDTRISYDSDSGFVDSFSFDFGDSGGSSCGSSCGGGCGGGCGS